MRVTMLAPMASLVLAPASALAIDYLNVEQAQKALFAQADAFALLSWTPASANGAPALQGARLYRASQGAQRQGWVVVDEVIGKFERITFAVGINPDGTVRGLEIMSYRESHGHEVRLPAWRRQFVGKSAASPLRVGDDIANISGATLSCTHLTDRVRVLLRQLQAQRQAGLA